MKIMRSSLIDNVAEITQPDNLVVWFPFDQDLEEKISLPSLINKNDVFLDAEGAVFGDEINVGKSSYFVINDPLPALDAITKFTLSTWCWVDTEGIGEPINFLARGGNASLRWRVHYSSGTHHLNWLLINDGVSFDVIIPEMVRPVPEKQWIHHAVTANLETGDIVFYFNGEVDVSTTTTKTSIIPAGSFRIGTCDGGESYKGKLKDLRIYDTDLTAMEVKQLYKQTTDDLSGKASKTDRLSVSGQFKEVLG